MSALYITTRMQVRIEALQCVWFVLCSARRSVRKSLLEEVQELEAHAVDPGAAVLRDSSGRRYNELQSIMELHQKNHIFFFLLSFCITLLHQLNVTGRFPSDQPLPSVSATIWTFFCVCGNKLSLLLPVAMSTGPKPRPRSRRASDLLCRGSCCICILPLRELWPHMTRVARCTPFLSDICMIFMTRVHFSLPLSPISISTVMFTFFFLSLF